jgi:hypothetical protein
MNKTYLELETELKHLLNSSYDKELGKRFKEVLGNFQELDFKLSVTFLKGLMSGLTTEQQTQRIKYILKVSNLRTEKSPETIREWKFKKSTSNITIYSNKDGKILDTHRQIKVGKSWIGNTIKMYSDIISQEERKVNPVLIESNGYNLPPMEYIEGSFYNHLGHKCRA